MAEDHIRFDILVQDALRGVIRKVLGEVSKTGLPGNHHFFISFVTRAPGVRLSQQLLDQYEKEMTIVLQNQFWDLKVNEGAFEVRLSFDGHPETLVVPFSAIKGFFDPSVQYGVQFDVDQEIHSDDEDKEQDEVPKRDITAVQAADATEGPGEKVVSLDQFRKKP